MKIIDSFLATAIPYVQVIIMDAEGCNQLLKRILHGRLDSQLRRRIPQTKVLSSVQYSDLEGLESLPRVPIKICTVEGHLLFGMPGMAHALKNSGGQLMSEVRVLTFGVHVADAVGGIECGLPQTAYQRKDPMSDRLSALLANPLFLVEDSWKVRQWKI